MTRKILRRHFLRFTSYTMMGLAFFKEFPEKAFATQSKNAKSTTNKSAMTKSTMNSHPFIKKANNGIYVHVGKQEAPNPNNGGDMSVMGFIVGTQSVAVIDTGHSVPLARQLLEAIRATTSVPIAHVILTHFHPDHIFGASVFAELDSRPEIWAHVNYPSKRLHVGPYYLEGLAGEIGAKAAQDAELIEPTKLVSVDDSISIDLGERMVRLEAWRTSHTDTDLTVLDEKTNSLLASDLLFDGRIPILAGSLLGWRKSLQDVKKRHHSMLIPGHGEPQSQKEGLAMIERLEEYFQVMEHDVRKILEQGGDIKQASETAAISERDKWLLFDNYNGRNAINATKELEWE